MSLTIAVDMRKTPKIDRIKKSMLKMATLVEETIEKATRAVIERDVVLAREVMQSDNVIDELEIEIEEDCLKTLALHQPVAIDLRYIISVLKINSEMERMGDLSVNIARTTSFLAESERIELGFDFKATAGIVRGMVEDTLNALLERDSALAMKAINTDDKVDEAKKIANDWCLKGIVENPEQAGTYLRFMSCMRNLERIGDHAKNICEYVIYLVIGKDVRHITIEQIEDEFSK